MISDFAARLQSPAGFATLPPRKPTSAMDDIVEVNSADGQPSVSHTVLKAVTDAVVHGRSLSRATSILNGEEAAITPDEEQADSIAALFPPRSREAMDADSSEQDAQEVPAPATGMPAWVAEVDAG